MSFETLLDQFLNASKIAVEHGTKRAWEFYDRVWDTVQEKANKCDSNLDPRREFMVVDENALTSAQKKV